MTNYKPTWMITGSVLAMAAAVCSLPASAQEAVSADPSSAQDAASPEDETLRIEEVVVTATKRSERLQDIPASVSAIGGESLERLSVTNIWDLTAKAANVRIDTSNNSVGPRIFVRGLGTNDVNANGTSSVSLYMDEVVLASPTLAGFPAFDLDRIEVLRGPQGTLWGVNTTGGLVHMVSRRPTEDFNGYARVSYGSFNEKNLEAAVGGSVIDGLLSARASGLMYDRDGWIYNKFNGEELGGKRQFAGRLQLLLTPDPDWSALLSLHARSQDGDSQVFVGRGALPGNLDARGNFAPYQNETANLNQDPNQSHLSQEGLSLNITGDLGFATLTSISAYEKADYRSFDDDDGTPVDVSRFFSIRPDVNQFTQELRLTSNDNGSPLSWIVGGFFLDGEVANASQGDIYSPGGGFGAACAPNSCVDITTITQNDRSSAVFASTDFRVTDKLKLSGGLRYTRDTKEIDLLDQFFTANPADPLNPANAIAGSLGNYQAPVSKKDSWSKVTYDAAAHYELTPDVALFGRIARGFRSGNFNGGVTGGGPVSAVKPEVLDSYELGLKSSAFDRKLTFNVTGYHYDYSDIQTFLITDASVLQLTNAGDGEVNGMEAELEARPFDNLTLGANVGYADTEFTTSFLAPIPGPPATDFLDVKGNSFQRAPKWTGHLEGEYEFDLGSAGNLYLFTGWSYQSTIYMNPINNDVPQGRGLTVPGFWLGDARVGYRTPDDRFELALWARNITDETYVVTSYGPYVGNWPSAYGMPQTFGISLRANFD
jgi:iron complex outermembrane receptor protein